MSNERWIMSNQRSAISDTPGLEGRIRVNPGKMPEEEPITVEIWALYSL